MSNTVTIDNTATVTWKAKDYVELAAGFTIEAGAVFEANIGDCTND